MLVKLPAAVVVLVLVLTGTAAASWQSAGSGSGSGRATALGQPGTGSAGAPTSSSLTLAWSAPGAGPAPTGYLVTRDGNPVTSGGCATTTTRTSTAVTCTDSGLAAATTYSYVVRAVLGTDWVGGASAAFAGTTASFSITSATPVGGSKKYRFGGSGSSGTTTITIEVCTGTLSTCTATSPTWVETVSFAPAGVGAWSSPPTGTKLELSPGPYTATASQVPNSGTLHFTV